MSDADEPHDPVGDTEQPGRSSDSGDPGDPGGTVGSVGEEAAKLFGALSDWARDQGAGPGAGPGAGAGAREALAHGLHEVGEHLATGSAECRYCPVCQVIHVVRQTSPEVRAHLASAAGSLAQAAAGLLATAPPSERGPVERIDLDDDGAWDEPGPSGEPGPSQGPGSSGQPGEQR